MVEFFEPWDSYKNYLLAKEQYNLEETMRVIQVLLQTLHKMTRLYALHAYLMYLKFGFGRATRMQE